MSSAIALTSRPVGASPSPSESRYGLSHMVDNLSLSSTSSSTTTSLLQLPDELLFHILSFLPVGESSTVPTLLAARRSCGRLSRIVADPAFWRDRLRLDYEITRSYPALFSDREYAEGETERYFKLKKTEWEVKEIVYKLAEASAKRETLLDELCQKAGAYSQGVLQRLSTITAEQDPQHWLSVRYWARVALGLTERVISLYDWASYIESGAPTGKKRGDECWALASFGAYTGDDSRQVIHQFANLNPSNLEEYAPLDDMSSEQLLRHLFKAFKAADLGRPAVEYESVLLQKILAGCSEPALAIQPEHVTMSSASVIVLVELLLKEPTVADVAILGPEIFLAVTFHAREILFLRVDTGRVMTKDEVTASFPSLKVNKIVTKGNRIPLEHRVSVDFLIQKTELHLEQILRRENPSLDFDQDFPCYFFWSPGRFHHSPAAYGAFVSFRHLRFIRNILTSKSGPNDDNQALPPTSIPTHHTLEKTTLSRVFGSLFTRSPTNVPSVTFMDQDTEEDVDEEFPDHEYFGCTNFCCDSAPRDFVSVVTGERGRKWFRRGYYFKWTPRWWWAGEETLAVVVAFEQLRSNERSDYDAKYLCVLLRPGRCGHIVTKFLYHSEILKSKVPPAPELLDISLDVGQYFGTISPAGILVPNAWLDRLLEEMDQKDSANKIYWDKVNFYRERGDYVEVIDEETWSRGVDSEADACEAKELKRNAFAAREVAGRRHRFGKGKGKLTIAGVTAEEGQKKSCGCGEKEKFRGKGRGELAKKWLRDDLVLDD